MYPIEVIIADDNSIFRKGLCSTLNEEPGISIAAQATNGKELVDLTQKHRPHIVLTDIKMPVMNGIEATTLISERFPDVITIALSMYDNEEMINEMLHAGAKGYLLKNEDKEEIVRAIKTVRKEVFYCNQTISKAFDSKVKDLRDKCSYSFSQKELSVMKLVCKEYSTKEIADMLDSTVKSIEHTKERIQNKTGAKNMVGIAIFAIRKMIVSFKELSQQDHCIL